MIKKKEVIGQFPAIAKMADEAIEKAGKNKNDSRWKDEAINWKRLRCACVEYVVGDGYEYFLVTIEDAAPNCSGLCNYVFNYLLEHGSWDIGVQSEW